MKTYTTGHCIGTDVNGNDWAIGKQSKSLKINGQATHLWDAIFVMVDSQPVYRTYERYAESFLTKAEAIEYCKSRCVKLY